MSFKLRIPHYFSATIRREIGELYISSAIADLAIAIVMIFEPIFLYTVLHFTLQEVLLFTALIYALYIVLIPFGAKIASRFGYEHSIFYSIPFMIAYWILLFGSQHNISLIYFAPLAYAIEKALFWPAFHADITRFARSDQRGREFSLLHAIINLMYIVGPFIGGLISERYGVRITFVVASAIYFCSFIPLFTTKEQFLPKIYEFKHTIELYRAYPKKFLGYLGFGEELLVLTVWPIFIYLIVKQYDETGVLATIATLAATALSLYIGKISDDYSKRVLIKVGAFFSALAWLARFVASSFWTVFFVDTFSRTSKEVVFIPISALTYERAEATHTMPYAVFFEQSLAIGKLLACIVGIVLFSLTGSFMVLFILAAVFSLLYAFI